MGPVVWDDELARVAQKWADQCANVDYKLSQGTILTVEDFCGKLTSCKFERVPNRSFTSFDMTPFVI